jgi:hypothetical protein
MEEINQLIEDLTLHLEILKKEYFDLHQQLTPYEGKLLSDFTQEERDHAMEIANNIVVTFRAMHPIFHFIAIHHHVVVNITNGFENFIKTAQGEDPKEEGRA